MVGDFLDTAKGETIAALRAELARLREAQAVAAAADSALASLQQKLERMPVSAGKGEANLAFLEMLGVTLRHGALEEHAF